MGNNTSEAGATPLGKLTGIDSQDETLRKVSDTVWVSKDISDSILIVTDAGNIVINGGMPGNGAMHRDRFRTVSDAPITHAIVTQCHVDHFGGVPDLIDSKTQIITQRRFPECREYWRILEEFYTARSGKLWGSVLGERRNVRALIREIEPDITFADSHVLEQGGQRLELFGVRGGESEDGAVVWLPQQRTLVTGNLFGPVFANMPNLYTIRGDKIRSARRFVDAIDFVLSLEPEVIVTGHEVIEGAQRIRDDLTRLRGAVMHVHDYTVDGMNAGRDVHTLMREVALPAQLQVGQAHGKLAWCVRAIWEEYAGWFHYDETTSLYGVPQSAVVADLVELAGGADPLAARAERYLEATQPLEALHLVQLALRVEPANPRALAAKIAAHEQLLAASGGENFSEVMWLKSEIAGAQSLLD